MKSELYRKKKNDIYKKEIHIKWRQIENICGIKIYIRRDIYGKKLQETEITKRNKKDINKKVIYIK